MTDRSVRVASLVMHARSLTDEPAEASALLVAAAALIVAEVMPPDEVGTALGALVDPWLTRPAGGSPH